MPNLELRQVLFGPSSPENVRKVLHLVQEDKKWIANQKQKIKSETQPYGHNFEAVATYKQYCDKRDPYYIYKMNDKHGNLDRPSFIFKSSKLGVKFALNMTEDEDHFLSKEFCCFDGKVNRCKRLVTLTASVCHPILRKQVILESMESESESTETVALFWSLFNEIQYCAKVMQTKFGEFRSLFSRIFERNFA